MDRSGPAVTKQFITLFEYVREQRMYAVISYPLTETERVTNPAV
jgi:hypothetical protein